MEGGEPCLFERYPRSFGWEVGACLWSSYHERGTVGDRIPGDGGGSGGGGFFIVKVSPKIEMFATKGTGGEQTSLEVTWEWGECERGPCLS